MRARHRAGARRASPAVIAGAALAIAAGAGAALGSSWAPASAAPAAPAQATAATPSPTPADPTAAARSLRALADLRGGDTVLYRAGPGDGGAPCELVGFSDAGPVWARVVCASGEVEVRVSQLASTTAARS